MKHFYFVRHGQTDANLQGLMCGAKWDIDLNENGIFQARDASVKLKQTVEQIATIYVSPLTRAVTTAKIIASHYDRSALPVSELQEWDIGSWDRVPFEQVKDEFLGTGEPVGGESRAEFRARAEQALTHCLQDPGPILIVSHGGMWLAFQEILKIQPIKVENCVPHKVFQNDDGDWFAQRL